ncbi:MAG: hypothetical protein L3K19_09470, partial [Thermoplasmata archaeon]|nr:hypothetical protein [Thermoplasmata archaeon]
MRGPARYRASLALAAYLLLFGQVHVSWTSRFHRDRRGMILPTPGQVVGSGPIVTVGAPGSTITVPFGNTTADIQINQAISNVSGSGLHGLVWLTGGASSVLTVSNQVVPLEGVDIWSDGVPVKTVNGWVQGPIFDNRGTSTNTLTNLTFFGLAFNANGANSGYTPHVLAASNGVPIVYPVNSPVTNVLVTASAPVTTVQINQATNANANLSLTGPWHITPTDVVTFGFAGGQTFTYTQEIDGWWTQATGGCR